MNFSQEELIDMVFVLGESNRNMLLARRIYHQQFPDRRQPRTEAFQSLLERFQRTGHVNYERTERTKNVVNEENELNVILSVTENPHISTSEIANAFDISGRSVGRILKNNMMHPYHAQLHQELKEDDYNKRVEFCRWAQEQIQNDASFFEYVLFEDEATFHKNGTVNRHNFHYYSTSNPHHIFTHSQIRWSLNVWGGIIGNYVIGPYFFEDHLNGEMYLHFLDNDLPELLEIVPLNIRQRMWILHDGAPVHHNFLVNEHLNYNFPGRWIGRGGPIRWPPRSPELNKLDFFFWGYIKDKVNKTPPTTKEDMKERIRNEFMNLNRNVLTNVSRSFEDRLQLCIDVDGGHFEHLL